MNKTVEGEQFIDETYIYKQIMTATEDFMIDGNGIKKGGGVLYKPIPQRKDMKVTIELYDGNLKLRSHEDEGFAYLDLGAQEIGMVVKIADIELALSKLVAK